MKLKALIAIICTVGSLGASAVAISEADKARAKELVSQMTLG